MAGQCPIRTVVYIAVSLHRSTHSLANRNSFRVEILQTEDINSVAVRRNALVVECVNATSIAKEMACCQSMKLIFGKLLFTSKQVEVAFMYFNHYRILKAADRTVTCRKLLEITSNFKLNGATMTITSVFLA